MTRRTKCILIVEDEYLIARDLADALEGLGWHILGPAGSIAQATALLDGADSRIDAAVLDVKLGDEWIDPFADTLQARDIKFMFATAYSTRIPGKFTGAPHCQKPCAAEQISRTLAGLLELPPPTSAGAPR